jgi:5'-3' exonuclease
MNDLIVDANSLYARCWFAVHQIPSEAMTLYVNSVLQFLDRRNGRLRAPIDRTLFAWDGASKTDKKRSKKPPGYIQTRELLQRALLTLFDTDNGFHPDFEADDIVATAAFDSKADTVFVVSGDKDLMQLQGGNIVYYCLNTKAILPTRYICQKFGIKQPNQVALALAVLGDRNDGISGIPKWGPKRLAALFESVTDKMDFGEALYVLQRQIPEELMGFFMESLDKTLLHTEVPGVPEPVPLRFCSETERAACGVKHIAQNYETVAMQYEDGDQAIDSALKASKRESLHRTAG